MEHIEMLDADGPDGAEGWEKAPADTTPLALDLQPDGSVKVSEAAALIDESVQQVGTAIATFNKAEAGMADLEKRYTGFQVENTPKGLDAAAAALAEIRRPRLDGSKLLDGAKKLLNKLKTDISSQFTAYEERCKALEAPIVEQVEAIKNARAIEKARNEQLERDRVEGIQRRIEAIRNIPLDVVGGDLAALEEAVAKLEATTTATGFDEWAAPAERQRVSSLERVNDMLLAKRMELQQAADMERQRQENALAQKRLDEQAADLRRQQAEFLAEQKKAREEAERPAREAAARAQAIETRMGALRAMGENLDRATSADLRKLLDAAENASVGVDLFADRAEEARTLRGQVLGTLNRRFEEAVASEAAQAEADAVAERQRQERAEAERVERERVTAEAALLSRVQQSGPRLLAMLKRVLSACGQPGTDPYLEALEAAHELVDDIEGNGAITNTPDLFAHAAPPVSITQADVDATNAEIQEVMTGKPQAETPPSTRDLVEGVIIKKANNSVFNDGTLLAEIGLGDAEIPELVLDVEEITGAELDTMDVEIMNTVGDLITATERALEGEA